MEDLSIPKELQEYWDKEIAADEVSIKQFVNLCVLVSRLIDEHWDQRKGMAYKVAGALLSNQAIRDNDLLHQLGSLGGDLEIPDAYSERPVEERWQEFKQLTQQAKEKYL